MKSSKSDVYRRQILTPKVDPRAVRFNISFFSDIERVELSSILHGLEGACRITPVLFSRKTTEKFHGSFRNGSRMLAQR